MFSHEKLIKFRRAYHSIMSMPLSDIAVAVALYILLCCVSLPGVWIGKVLLGIWLFRMVADWLMYILFFRHKFDDMPTRTEELLEDE